MTGTVCIAISLSEVGRSMSANVRPASRRESLPSPEEGKEKHGEKNGGKHLWQATALVVGKLSQSIGGDKENPGGGSSNPFPDDLPQTPRHRESQQGKDRLPELPQRHRHHVKPRFIEDPLKEKQFIVAGKLTGSQPREYSIEGKRADNRGSQRSKMGRGMSQ